MDKIHKSHHLSHSGNIFHDDEMNTIIAGYSLKLPQLYRKRYRLSLKLFPKIIINVNW